MQNNMIADMQAPRKKFSPPNVVQKPDFRNFTDLPPVNQNRVSHSANKGSSDRKGDVNSGVRPIKHYFKSPRTYAEAVKNFPSQRPVQAKSAKLPYQGVPSRKSALHQNAKSKRSETLQNYSVHTGENFYKRNEAFRAKGKNFQSQMNGIRENRQNHQNLHANTSHQRKFFPVPQSTSPSDMFIRAIGATKLIKDSSSKPFVKKFSSNIFGRAVSAKNADVSACHMDRRWV